jgi:hypothetical protein
MAERVGGAGQAGQDVDAGERPATGDLEAELETSSAIYCARALLHSDRS